MIDQSLYRYKGVAACQQNASSVEGKALCCVCGARGARKEWKQLLVTSSVQCVTKMDFKSVQNVLLAENHNQILKSRLFSYFFYI